MASADAALQRTGVHRGRPVLGIDCALAAEMRLWPAAELGR
jgi:hypothetical protein